MHYKINYIQPNTTLSVRKSGTTQPSPGPKKSKRGEKEKRNQGQEKKGTETSRTLDALMIHMRKPKTQSFQLMYKIVQLHT